jgi:hypothetical protein
MYKYTSTLLVILSLVYAIELSAEPEAVVNVVVDMTKEGRALTHPTSEHPVYYLPIIGGYKELGEVVAGQKEPEKKPIIHGLAVELAKQGYFVVSKKNSNPDIIISIHWGSMNPQVVDLGMPDDPSSKMMMNRPQMLGLVAGNTLGNIGLDFEREEIIQATDDDRYFVVLSAYDFKVYQKSHKKVLLWQAKMSIPSNHVTMDEVIPALIKAGGPMFGRETIRPQQLILPLTPEGKVEVGTPTVKDYQDAPETKKSK